MTERSHHQPNPPSQQDHAQVILNRLEEEQGFRPGWSTVEQICNSQGIIEQHLQHQCNLFHNFIDFKTVSGMQTCSWSLEVKTQRKDWLKPFRYCIRTPAAQSSWTVSLGSSSRQQQVSIRNDYCHPSCSTCSSRRSSRKYSMTITCPVADHIYATYNSRTILQVAAMVVDRARAYGMAVSTEKRKIMTNNTNNIRY